MCSQGMIVVSCYLEISKWKSKFDRARVLIRTLGPNIRHRKKMLTPLPGPIGRLNTPDPDGYAPPE